eukprot:1032156-Amphidinium_carterae.1
MPCFRGFLRRPQYATAMGTISMIVMYVMLGTSTYSSNAGLSAFQWLLVRAFHQNKKCSSDELHTISHNAIE